MPELKKLESHTVDDYDVFTIVADGTLTFKGESCSVKDVKGKEIAVLEVGNETCGVRKGYKCYPLQGTISLK